MYYICKQKYFLRNFMQTINDASHSIHFAQYFIQNIFFENTKKKNDLILCVVLAKHFMPFYSKTWFQILKNQCRHSNVAGVSINQFSFR